MEFQEVLSGRRSIRKYKQDQVEKEKILAVLEAGRLAPSWKNMQGWQYIVVEAPEVKAKVIEAFEEDNPGKKCMEQAPVLIVICGNPNQSGIEDGKEYYLVDAGISFEHVILAAHNLGLGTCFMGLFKEDILKKNLNIPDGWRPVGVTPLGYPDQEPKQRPRKALEDIVFSESWGQPLNK